MSKLEIDIDVGETVKLETFKQFKGDYTPFRMIGKLGYTEYQKLGVSTMDTWQIAMKFNTSEQWLMGLITEAMEDNTMVAVIRGKSLTPAE